MGSPEANAIPVLGDETISVTLETPVYTSDEQAASTYEKIWTSLRSGASLRLCFNSSGKLEYIYMPSRTASVSDDNVLVAKNKPTGSNNPSPPCPAARPRPRSTRTASPPSSATCASMTWGPTTSPPIPCLSPI